MITVKGVGFIIVAILVFVLGRFTQVGWLYLVDAVLWGIFVLGALVPWLGVSFLSGQRRLVMDGSPAHGSTGSPRAVTSPLNLPSGQNPPLPPFAKGGLGGFQTRGDSSGFSPAPTGPVEGEPVRLELVLRNRAFWPRFFLSLGYHCPLAGPEEQWQRLFMGELPGAGLSRPGRLAVTSTVTAYHRGMHQLGPVLVESAAPFGMFRRRAWLPAPLSVLVYPQVFPIQRMGLVDGLSGTAAQPRKSRLGMETVGARHYFPGDPRRHIHWRNTARVGRPMVKEFEEPRDQTLHLLFDATRPQGQGKENTLEYAIKVIASVAAYALGRRTPVRVWGGGLQGEEWPWPELHQALALVKPEAGLALAQSVGQVPPGASVLAVVDGADPAAVRAIGQGSSMWQRTSVVALEGFVLQRKDDSGPDSLALLEQAGVPVARCAPGGIQEALAVLGQAGEGSQAPLSAGRGPG